MITNEGLTIYHKELNTTTRLETYTKYTYSKVWMFGVIGSVLNEGINQSNNIDIRIPYHQNTIDLLTIALGDIVVKGTNNPDITKPSDLPEYYTIVSIKDNNFGTEPHIHLGVK